MQDDFARLGVRDVGKLERELSELKADFERTEASLWYRMRSTGRSLTQTEHNRKLKTIRSAVDRLRGALNDPFIYALCAKTG